MLNNVETKQTTNAKCFVDAIEDNKINEISSEYFQ